MIVVVANSLPPAIRGRMKLWFIEPKPNTFVSGVKNHIALKIVDYLFENCPVESGLLVFIKDNSPQGFKVRTMGSPKKKIVNFDGLSLVLEKNQH